MPAKVIPIRQPQHEEIKIFPAIPYVAIFWALIIVTVCGVRLLLK